MARITTYASVRGAVTASGRCAGRWGSTSRSKSVSPSRDGPQRDTRTAASTAVAIRPPATPIARRAEEWRRTVSTGRRKVAALASAPMSRNTATVRRASSVALQCLESTPSARIPSIANPATNGARRARSDSCSTRVRSVPGVGGGTRCGCSTSSVMTASRNRRSRWPAAHRSRVAVPRGGPAWCSIRWREGAGGAADRVREGGTTGIGGSGKGPGKAEHITNPRSCSAALVAITGRRSRREVREAAARYGCQGHLSCTTTRQELIRLRTLRRHREPYVASRLSDPDRAVLKARAP
ncbi:hypothetical protein SALBM135S_08596 [Streptomyces alboniger]